MCNLYQRWLYLIKKDTSRSNIILPISNLILPMSNYRDEAQRGIKKGEITGYRLGGNRNIMIILVKNMLKIGTKISSFHGLIFTILFLKKNYFNSRFRLPFYIHNTYFYNKITKTLFLQIFGHAAFIKQKVR